MRTSRHLGRAVFAALVAAWLPVGCFGSTGTDSNTHWLDRCVTDADCGASLSCLCGICSESCTTSSACEWLSPDARCATLSRSLCGDERTPPACVAPCEETRDCPASHLSCIDGQCLPREQDAATSSDAMTNDAADGAGGNSGSDGDAAEAGSGGADAGSTGGTGGIDASDGSAGDSDASAGGGGGGSDASAGGGGSTGGSGGFAGGLDAGTKDSGADAAPVACTADFAVAWGDTDVQMSRDLALDSQGSSIVVGYFQSTLMGLGGQPYLTADPPAGYEDAFVAKLDAAGQAIWRTKFGGPNGGSQYALAVAVDANDDVYVGGSFATEIVIGPTTLTSPGGFYGKDGYVAKLSGTDGTVLDVHQLGGAGEQWLTDLRVEATPPYAIVAVGDFDTEIDCSDGTTPATCPSAGGRDVFVAKIWDTTARRVWTYGGLDNQWATGVALDEAGSAALTGYFKGSLSFGGTTPTLTAVVGASADLTDAFVARIDLPATQTGAVTPVFARAFSGGGCPEPSLRTGRTVVFDRSLGTSGDVWVAGDYSGCIDLTGTRRDAPDDGDAFLVRLDHATGSPKHERLIAATGWQHATSLAVDPAGFVFLGGTARNTVTFDELGASPPIGLESPFILRVAPDDTYTWVGRWGGSSFTSAAANPQIDVRTVNATTVLGISGTFISDLDFGGGMTVQSGGSADPWVTRMSCGW